MNTAAQRLLDPRIVDLSKLVVKALKPGPLLLPKDIHERWKIETRVIAHVLILTRLRSVDVEVNNFGVDIVSFLKGPDKWPNILESGSSDQLGSWVFQEAVIDF